MLLAWHDSYPFSDWELHRNAAIAEIQGNRNPMIDHPEWVTLIRFAKAFDVAGSWL
jgi:endonuclease G